MKVYVRAPYEEACLAELKEIFDEVVYEPWTATGQRYYEDEMLEHLLRVQPDALITELDRVTEKVLAGYDHLKFIGDCRGTPANLQVDACTKAGVPILCTPGRNTQAVAEMVDGNVQRENVLPSERAFAFKMKLEAMKHQGQRLDLTCSQVGNKLEGKKSSEILAEQVGFIRLTELLPELLDLVDERKLAFNSAVEVSYLNPEEQGWLAETIDSEQSTPSLSQAQRLKRFSQDGKLTEDMVLAIMSEQKKPETQSRQISQYFSPSATPKEMETSILSMLDTAKEWRSYFPEDNTLDDVNRRMRKVLEGMKRTKSRAPER